MNIKTFESNDVEHLAKEYLEHLAKEYLDRTETYDRSISRGEIINDEIRLEGKDVRKLSTAFARNVRRDICHKASPLYLWKEIHDAIQHSHRWYRFEPWVEDLNTLHNTTGDSADK